MTAALFKGKDGIWRGRKVTSLQRDGSRGFLWEKQEIGRSPGNERVRWLGLAAPCLFTYAKQTNGQGDNIPSSAAVSGQRLDCSCR